eukprot:scaffold250258_cov15-Tisochrysis_lutea.AAC.1
MRGWAWAPTRATAAAVAAVAAAVSAAAAALFGYCWIRAKPWSWGMSGPTQKKKRVAWGDPSKQWALW